MYVMRIGSICGNAREHRHAPRISAEQPIELLRGELTITMVAGHAFVQRALRRERDREIVGAPDEWHADAIRIRLALLHGAFNAVTIEIRQLFLHAWLDEIVKTKVTRVHERIKLVMASLLFSHP